jgi:hypothetical protein
MSLCDTVTPGRVTRDADAKRAKTYRARRREGLRCVTIMRGVATIQTLEENGYLEGGRDGRKLADAVELFISDHMPK